MHRAPIQVSERQPEGRLKWVELNLCLALDRFTENTFWFKGNSAADKVEHEVSLELFGNIKNDSIKFKNIGRCVEFVLPKEDPMAEYWPRLTKSSQKLSFLRVDFKKWVDEDEEPAAPDQMNNMSSDFGDMNFGNFMGGGMGGDNKLDFYDDALEDSDDDDLEGPPPAEDVEEEAADKAAKL